MAKCDQGYGCDVCGEEVEEMIDSDLYLRYVLGEVTIDILHVSQERHIRCNPSLAQFIVDPEFVPLRCDGAFDKTTLDAVWVAEQENRVTRAWRRLRQLPNSGLPLRDYPLPDALKDSR